MASRYEQTTEGKMGMCTNYVIFFTDRNDNKVELGTTVVTDAPNNKTIGEVEEISFSAHGKVMVKLVGGASRVDSKYVTAYSMGRDESEVRNILLKAGMRVKPEKISEITKDLKNWFHRQRT